MRAAIARTVLLGLCALGLTSAAIGAGRDPLALGDPAPALNVDAWVDDKEITIGEENIYVVLFWGNLTRAGNLDDETTKSIAKLRSLLELFGDRGLTAIVISPDTVETLASAVRSGPSVGLHVAADRRSSTHRAWVRQAGVKDLPVAFIVGKGKIMHIGKPREPDFINILTQVMTGRYDPQLQEEAQPKLDMARRARKVKNWRMATKFYGEVIAMDPTVFAVIALERFEMMLVDMDDAAAAYEYARKQLIEQMFASDAGALQMLAISITEDPELTAEQRDFDVAIEAALRALELDGRRNPGALSCAAQVHFHRGETNEAISLQTQAYFTAKPDQKAAYKRLLDGYRKAATRSHASSSPG